MPVNVEVSGKTAGHTACLLGAELTLTALDGAGNRHKGTVVLVAVLEQETAGTGRSGWEATQSRGSSKQGQTNVSQGAGRRGVRWARFSPGEGRLCEMPGGGEGSD